MSIVSLDNKAILVTGVAGFISSNLVKGIYQNAPSKTVIGIDNMNAYYDIALKEYRLKELTKYPTFTFIKGNIADKALITQNKPAVVVNLVAQAGVSYAIANLDVYVESNLVGFFNILEAEACCYRKILQHLVYTSSFSVYDDNKKVELIDNNKSLIQDEYIEKYLAKKQLDLTETIVLKMHTELLISQLLLYPLTGRYYDTEKMTICDEIRCLRRI